MSSKAHAFEPTHVFANLSPRILSSSNENKSETQHRRVEVSGTAEFNVPPDLCVLTIVIENRKEKADEAKSSVARRLDYVTQTLTNHSVQNNDMEITENLSRVNGRGFFHMEAQVDAVFHQDLQKCLQISNLFVEKLDKCVKVLPPMLKHDPQRLEVTRKQTCLTALANARQKALDVCRLMGQNLGRPVFITENVVREWRGSGAPEQVVPGAEAPLPSVDGVTNGPITVQRRMKEQSLTIRVDVTATFDIRCRLEKEKK
uniref:Interleukin-1 receptor-associated kinase 1-binding protein 1 homolog n=1 Tax=Ciona savignyi TaxID=51511 RepID=H2Y888_CIOSA